MPNKYAGGVKAGSTSVSTDVLLLSVVDGSELTGKVAADFSLSYRRQGGARVTVTPVALAALTTAWTSGGVKEDMGGLYRVDFPDAAYAAGVEFVLLEGFVSGSQIFHERVPLEAVGAAEVKVDTAAIFGIVDTEVAAILSLSSAINAAVAAIKSITDQFRFTTPNIVDASGGGGGGGDPAAIAAAVGAGIVEPHGSITRDQATRLMLSVLAGVTTSGGLVFKTPDGTTVRLQVTANSQKERVIVTATPGG